MHRRDGESNYSQVHSPRGSCPPLTASHAHSVAQPALKAPQALLLCVWHATMRQRSLTTEGKGLHPWLHPMTKQHHQRFHAGASFPRRMAAATVARCRTPH